MLTKRFRLVHIIGVVSFCTTLTRCGPGPFCMALSTRQNMGNLCFLKNSADFHRHSTGGLDQDRGNADKENSMRLLKMLIETQGLTDDAFLGKPRFSLDTQRRTFSTDLAPIPLDFILSRTDPLARPLEILLRTEVLRRDFRVALPDEKFWRISLDSIEQTVNACLQNGELREANSVETTNRQRCYAEVDQIFDQLETQIAGYANTHRLERIEPLRPRDPIVGYRITVRVEPPRARVRVMPLLEYKKYKYLQTSEKDYQWTDLLDTENRMIGWYHYRVEWPSELNGAEEGDFEIKNPGTMTFRPAQR